MDRDLVEVIAAQPVHEREPSSVESAVATDAPLHILLVTNDFPPKVGGIQTYLFNLYSRIAEAGVKVTVVAPKEVGVEAFDRTVPSGMRVVRHRQMVWPTPFLRRKVKRLAREADVLISGATLPMSVALRNCGKPIVMHTAGLEVTWARFRPGRRYLKRVLSQADLTTVLSDYTRRALSSVTTGPVMKLLTGIDVDAYPAEPDASEFRRRYGLGDRPVICFVSRLVKRKGADQLIRVLPALRKRIPDATLLVVGDGPDRKRLERLASAHHLPLDAVVFAGMIPSNDLPLAFAAGNVFAMPCRSRWFGLEVEGLGIVYLEAQALSRPVVTGASGGAPEAVLGGRTGVTVDGRDQPGLLSALVRLLSDRAASEEMGRRGRAFVSANFDERTIAGDLLERIRGLAGRS